MKKKIVPILVHLELVLMSLLVLVPVIWIVMSSFNEGDGLASATLIPENLTLENYQNLFQETDYALWFWNTFKIAVTNTFFSVIMVMITSWIMSRFDFRGKKFGLMR